MDNRNVSILGMRSGINKSFMVEPVPFGIEQNDRLRHLYIVGKTGTGKTTLLQNLILQDIEEGRGFALLDPLGDLADELLDRSVIAAGVVGAFKHIYEGSWGDRLEWILINAHLVDLGEIAE